MAGVALVATLALAGCATGGSPAVDEDAGTVADTLYERKIQLTDGREITCIVYSSGYRGGLSCDWGGATE